jgi:hypothetical protein
MDHLASISVYQLNGICPDVCSYAICIMPQSRSNKIRCYFHGGREQASSCHTFRIGVRSICETLPRSSFFEDGLVSPFSACTCSACSLSLTASLRIPWAEPNYLSSLTESRSYEECAGYSTHEWKRKDRFERAERAFPQVLTLRGM